MLMIISKCQKCGNSFMVKDSEIKRGGGKYCSPKCWYKSGKLKGINKSVKFKHKCISCGKEYEIPHCYEVRGNSKYCSDTCKHKHNVGKNNPNYKNASKTILCKLCGKSFISGNHRIKQGRGIFCSHSCNSIYNMAHNKKFGTSIELKMEKELIKRGVDFKKQYPIWQAKTIPDFFILPNICVYCDGDYWHNRPEAKIKDKQQDFILRFLGYSVYRFWEKDINKDISKCVDSIYDVKGLS